MGFFVSLSGDIQASGVPKAEPALAKLQWQQDELTKSVAQAADFIQPGVSFSNLVAHLGPPPLKTYTNNGVVIVDYMFGFPFVSGTNGFTVYLSNDVVIGKAPILGR